MTSDQTWCRCNHERDDHDGADPRPCMECNCPSFNELTVDDQKLEREAELMHRFGL